MNGARARQEREPRVYSRLYLPYCAGGSRNDARNGLMLDVALWAGVLALVAFEYLLKHL